MDIKIKILHPSAVLPEYATAGSAAADLRAAVDAPVVIRVGERALVPCGA